MKNEVIARPYARALFQLAQQRQQEEQLAQELGQVLMVWDGERNFRQFIRRPEIPTKIKREVIHRIFPDLDAEATRLLNVVIEKHRESMLGTIYEVYRSLWDESRGITHADVTTAGPLAEDQTEALAQALGRAMGRTVKVTLKRDPSLLGGAVIRIGDRVLDGSLSHRLTVLGERLRSGDGGGSVVEH